MEVQEKALKLSLIMEDFLNKWLLLILNCE